MGLIENNHRLLGQLFRHQVSYLGIKKVMVAVNHNVGMQDLQKRRHEMNNHHSVSVASAPGYSRHIFVYHFFHIFIYKQAEIIKIYFNSFKIYGFKQYRYTVTFLADNDR